MYVGMCKEFFHDRVVMVMYVAYHTGCTVAAGEDEKCSSQGNQFHLHLLYKEECIQYMYMYKYTHSHAVHTCSVTRIYCMYLWFKNIH